MEKNMYILNIFIIKNFIKFQSGISLNPVRVLKEEAGEERAETARLSSFVGAMAVGDLVKSTLGPKGMDKILWGMGRNEGIVEVTNDGATILKAIGVDNPAAKVLVEMSKVQVNRELI
jgi:T-complex protein 1 subunit beta